MRLALALLFTSAVITYINAAAARHLHQHQSISPHAAAALQAERLPDQLPKRRRHVPQLRPQLPNARPWTHQPLQAVSTSANISPIDVVKNAVDSLEEGSTISIDLMKQVKKVVQKVDETIKVTERKIQELTEKIGSIEETSDKLTGEVFQKYDQVKKDMRAARRKLRSLADKTKIACKDLEIYIEGWNNEVDNGDKRLYLQMQIDIMEGLMKESLELLTEAEKKYVSAIDNVDGVTTKLWDFQRFVKKLLNKKSAEHKQWKTKLRAGAYGTSGALTVGMIIADVLGCLGICSGVVTSSAWITATATAEGNIAIVKQHFEELETIGNSIKADFGDIRTQTSNLMTVLQTELRIVASWKTNAQNLNGKLDRLSLDSFDRLPFYRNSFLRSVLALRKSAEEYLNQPVVLFTFKYH